MRRNTLLLPLAAASIVLGACSPIAPQNGATAPPTTSTTQQATASSTQPQPSTPGSPTPSESAEKTTLTIPTDLIDTTLGEAKERLAKLGFTNFVTAGGDLTDEDPVVDVPQAGESAEPDTEIILVGRSPQARQQPQQPQQRQQSNTDAAPGCGQRAVESGQFNPQCEEYQGYLDPGTIAGRGPTSGEIQRQYGCEQGYIPESECPG